MRRIQPSEGAFYARRTGGEFAFRWCCHDGAAFRLILDDCKTIHGAKGLRFDDEAREWRLSAQYAAHLRAWAGRWFTSEAQRWTTVDNGWDAHSRPGSSETARGVESVDAAYKALCLQPTAPRGLIDTAYKYWTRELHPDTGHGDTAAMARVNDAVALLREAVPV